MDSSRENRFLTHEARVLKQREMFGLQKVLEIITVDSNRNRERETAADANTSICHNIPSSGLSAQARLPHPARGRQWPSPALPLPALIPQQPRAATARPPPQHRYREEDVRWEEG